MASSKIKKSDIGIVVVVLVAIILSVSLFISQLPGFTDNPNGPNSKNLQIIDVAQNRGIGTLIVYVENIGSAAVDLIGEISYSVNDIEIPLFDESFDKNILEGGEIATVQVPFKISPDIPIVIKIMSNGATLTEWTVNNPDVLPNAYTLTVNIQGDSANKVAKIPDQSSYSDGSTVNLIAEPIEGWSFSDWSGDVVSSSNPLSLVIDGDKTVNAKFVEGDGPTPTPTATPTPTPTPTPGPDTVDVTFTQVGLDSSAAGTILTVQGTSKSFSDFPFTLSVNRGSSVNYDFSDLVSSSSSGERFILASIAGADSPLSATSDMTIRANYESQFEVVFSSDPEIADATTQPEGAHWFNASQEVLISTDISSVEFVFFQWETSNQDNQIENINATNTSVIIDGPGSITAIYRTTKFIVSFDQNGIDDTNLDTSVSYSINNGATIVSTVPFEVLVEYGDSIEFEYQQIIAGVTGVRYNFTSTSHISPITITEDVEIVGNYDLQYLFAFSETGLDGSAIGTVLTIDGEELEQSDLPTGFDWYNSGTTYNYSGNVSAGVNKRFLLVSPIGIRTITAPGFATGNYKVQYFFEVNSPVGSPTGEGWYDDGTTVSSSSGSPVLVTGPPKIEYTATGYDGTGSAPNGVGTTVEFSIDQPSSITWNWEGIATLYPNGELIEEGIPSTTGFTRHWRCVSDFGNPDLTNYVYAEDLFAPFIPNYTEYLDYYSLEDLGSITGTIDSVTLNAKSLSSGGNADSKLYLRVDGYSRSSAVLDLTQNWDNYSFSPSKPGGWSWTDINDLEVGVSLTLNNDEYARCTLVWIEVTFTV